MNATDLAALATKTGCAMVNHSLVSPQSSQPPSQQSRKDRNSTFMPSSPIILPVSPRRERSLAAQQPYGNSASHPVVSGVLDKAEVRIMKRKSVSSVESESSEKAGQERRHYSAGDEVGEAALHLSCHMSSKKQIEQVQSSARALLSSSSPARAQGEQAESVRGSIGNFPSQAQWVRT